MPKRIRTKPKRYEPTPTKKKPAVESETEEEAEPARKIRKRNVNPHSNKTRSEWVETLIAVVDEWDSLDPQPSMASFALRKGIPRSTLQPYLSTIDRKDPEEAAVRPRKGRRKKRTSGETHRAREKRRRKWITKLTKAIAKWKKLKSKEEADSKVEITSLVSFAAQVDIPRSTLQPYIIGGKDPEEAKAPRR